MSSFLNPISLSFKKVRYGDSCFFIVLIYLPRMTDLAALPNMRTAVSSISIYWRKPTTPYKLLQTLCVSRGLQWSRIQITLPKIHSLPSPPFGEARLFEQTLNSRQNVTVEIAQYNSLKMWCFLHLQVVPRYSSVRCCPMWRLVFDLRFSGTSCLTSE
jgi:hypothetical protein